MKFKRLAAAVMAATMCGSLFVGCGNAKKDDTAAGEEKMICVRKDAIMKTYRKEKQNGN